MNLSEALYAAINGAASVTIHLADYQARKSVHTKQPVPADATYPLAVVSNPLGGTEADLLNMQIRNVLRNILIYGNLPGDLRAVDEAAEAVHSLFHRANNLLNVTNYRVFGISASEPRPAPTDQQKYGAMVPLLIQMQKIA